MIILPLKNSFLYGSEPELGDIPRNRIIPPELGKWDYIEQDGVNLKPPYKGVGFDPKGIDPPVGGEINTTPTNSVKSQIEIIKQIFELFPEATCASMPNNWHFHISYENIKENVDLLKQIAKYIFENQKDFVLKTFELKFHPLMKFTKTAGYIVDNNCSMMTEQNFKNILQSNSSKEIADNLYTIHKTWNISQRNAINLQSVLKHGTIEFRCFYGSMDLYEIQCSLESCDEFLKAAIFTNEPILDIFKRNKHWKFPKCEFDFETYKMWEKTCKRPL